jgi:hypothetical protein
VIHTEEDDISNNGQMNAVGSDYIRFHVSFCSKHQPYGPEYAPSLLTKLKTLKDAKSCRLYLPHEAYASFS